MAENLRVTVRIEGAREVLRALRELPPEASDLLRTKTKEISESLAAQIRAAAYVDSPQSALIAPTVKARRDRIPSIQAGGAMRVGRNRKPAYKILFGSEFGATTLRQFRPHVGAGSYWFFRTVESQEGRIEREWSEMAAELIHRWNA